MERMAAAEAQRWRCCVDADLLYRRIRASHMSSEGSREGRSAESDLAVSSPSESVASPSAFLFMVAGGEMEARA